jgi:hypothetical protein
MDRAVGDIADEILILQLKIKKKEQEVEVLDDKVKGLKLELQVAADVAKLTQGGGKKSKFTIEDQTVPQGSNWDQFYDYIHTNKYFHLLQRRPAVKACQELWGQGVVIPGIDKFTMKKINVKGV